MHAAVRTFVKSELKYYSKITSTTSRQSFWRTTSKGTFLVSIANVHTASPQVDISFQTSSAKIAIEVPLYMAPMRLRQIETLSDNFSALEQATKDLDFSFNFTPLQ